MSASKYFMNLLLLQQVTITYSLSCSMPPIGVIRPPLCTTVISGDDGIYNCARELSFQAGS